MSTYLAHTSIRFEQTQPHRTFASSNFHLFRIFCNHCMILISAIILVSPEAGGHYRFGAHCREPDKEKSAFIPVIRGCTTPGVISTFSHHHEHNHQHHHETPAPVLFHHQPAAGWHYLAVQC